MKIKPITIPCADVAAANALAQDYREIGIATRRQGRMLRVLTTEYAPATHETAAASPR